MGQQGSIGRAFLRGMGLFVLFAAVATALQAATFGDTNRHADETFYFLAGQRMHDGLMPYVDIWDRKPLGLFLIYYLIAGISHSVIAYQIAACLFAAATAVAICYLVSRLAGPKGGVLAALGYLFIIGPFEGSTGQSPDFYNLFIATSALLISLEIGRLLEGKVRWRIYVAMALCGLAITIKHTALFESLYFGLCVLICLWQADVQPVRIVKVAAVCCLIGALPTLFIAAFYWEQGRWWEFWNAMVTSNLSKARAGGEVRNAIGIVLKALPLLVFAVWGLLGKSVERYTRLFVAGWLLTALIGFFSVPNFYIHYALPLLVPVSVAAGLLFGRHRFRTVLFMVLALYAMMWRNPFEWTQARQSADSMTEIAGLVRKHDRGGGLLVFDGPPYLYALTGERFLSPLVFPHHLNHQIENNVSHIDTRAEIDRIVRNRPGVIVMSSMPRNHPVNLYARGRVLTYARENCRSVTTAMLHEQPFRVPIAVFGECL